MTMQVHQTDYKKSPPFTFVK
ncbi:WD repeat-containing protein 19 [Trichinella spiralis]|nr:WD repeat-containing protein 19 [Trichinella spiralis]